MYFTFLATLEGPNTNLLLEDLKTSNEILIF
ncbi:hypothetical protein FLACHUCJ7_02296 [Flavobacterium chungangense]|uniref:Uncharacterized protein n=1 Tax=Flavobacterium chungangense TaxID=554283 RepID=A0A6V6Z0S1_9FLAO|nr:hypothetical protein FLACHUCJ7_02296 [Flavobacterium chungangense]